MKIVEIFTRSFCPHCHRAKALLAIKGAPFIEYNISADPRLLQEMRRRSGHDAVPQVYAGGGLIGGCEELFDLDEKDQLGGLLGVSPEWPE